MKTLLLPAVALASAVAAWGDSRRGPGDAVPAPLVREVSSRAEEHGIPPAEALAPLREAVGLGVPVELVAEKVLEGLSKGIPPARISAVARDLTGRLAVADEVLRQARGAGLAPAPDRQAALLDLGAALGSGIGRPELDSLLTAARGSRGGSTDSVVSGALIMGELARRDVSRSDAMTLGAAIARQGPRPPGELGALFDAWRAEGGKDPRAFVSEAARRVENGRKLESMVDAFGESPDRVVSDRGAKTDPDGSGVAGNDVGMRGADHDLGPAERADAARGAVPGVDDAVRGRGNARGKTK